MIGSSYFVSVMNWLAPKEGRAVKKAVFEQRKCQGLAVVT